LLVAPSSNPPVLNLTPGMAGCEEEIQPFG
jgi:hypothetical protein